MPIISKAKTIDLGTLDWTLTILSENRHRFTATSNPQNIRVPMIGEKPRICVNGYDTFTRGSSVLDKQVGIATDGMLMILDNSFDDATAFKAAMSGVMLTYETVDTVEECIISKYKKYNQLISDSNNKNWRYATTPAVDDQINLRYIQVKTGNVFAVLYYYKNMPIQTTQNSIFQIYDMQKGITYASVADSGVRGDGTWRTIFKATKDSDQVQILFRVNRGIVYDVYLERMVVDLTAIYGAGNEPTTISQFLSDYPEYNSYVPYTKGSLLLVEHGTGTSGEQYVDIEEVIL